MERSANLSSDGQYRWSLKRGWGEGGVVCWIMLNPSTADAEKDDPTLRSIIKRSQGWGYGALVVVNRYPFRSSHPATCRKWTKHAPPGDLLHNAIVVKTHMDRADLIIAAWGAATWLQGTAGGYDLYCIGTNADGSPKHPLARGIHHVPIETPPQLWRKHE